MEWEELNKRRLELGMSMSDLARLSKVSLPTVQRILNGKAPHASIANVLAIAAILGVRFALQMNPAATICRERALEKARKLVGMVQATSALEGHSLGARSLDKMVAKTVCELLDAGKRSLWSE